MDRLQLGLLVGGSLTLVAGVTGALTGAYLMIPSLSVAVVTDPTTGIKSAAIGTQYLGTFETPWYTGTGDLMTRMGYNYAIYSGKSFALAGIQPPNQNCMEFNPDPGFTGLPSAWGCLNGDFNLLSIWAEDGNESPTSVAQWRFGSPDVPDYLIAVGALALLFAWWRRQ